MQRYMSLVAQQSRLAPVLSTPPAKNDSRIVFDDRLHPHPVTHSRLRPNSEISYVSKTEPCKPSKPRAQSSHPSLRSCSVQIKQLIPSKSDDSPAWKLRRPLSDSLRVRTRSSSSYDLTVHDATRDLDEAPKIRPFSCTFGRRPPAPRTARPTPNTTTQIELNRRRLKLNLQ